MPTTLPASNMPANVDVFTAADTAGTLGSEIHHLLHNVPAAGLLAVQNLLVDRFDYNLRNAKYGGQADGVLVNDLTVSAGNLNIVNSASLTAAASGKTVMIDGAGPGGGVLTATLSAATSGSATLNTAASTAVTNAGGVWGTDDTAAWNAMLADWFHTGGWMWFGGVSLVTGQLLIPNDGVVAAPTNGQGPPNSPQLVGPWQPPGGILGYGGHWDGQWGGTLKAGGSILATSCTTNPAIFTAGTGAFLLQDLTFLMMTPDGVYLFEPTNTTLFAMRGSVSGRPSKSATTCTQKVFKLGGSSTTVGTSPNAPFQGYGTVIEDWYFDRINHSVEDGEYANGFILNRLTHSNTCGSTSSGDSPVFLSQAGNVNARLTDIVMEDKGGYAGGYVVTLSGWQNVVVDNPICAPDPAGTYGGVSYPGSSNAGLVHMTNGAANNEVRAGYRANPLGVPVIVEDSASLGLNKLSSSQEPADSGLLDVTLSANQPLTVSTITTVVWNAYSDDEGGTTGTQDAKDPGHLLNTSTGVVTIKVSGKYLIQAQLCYANGTASQASVNVVHNATSTNKGGRATTGGQAQVAVNVTTVMKLKAGDTISITTFAFGAGDSLLASNCFLTMHRLP
jgi:hypothetical protein